MVFHGRSSIKLFNRNTPDLARFSYICLYFSSSFLSHLPSKPVKAPLTISRRTHVIESHQSPFFFSEALKFSAKNGFLSEGKQVHCHLVKQGFDFQQSLQNHLLNMYIKCGALSEAGHLFDEMPERSVVSWNIMISGFVGFSCDEGLFEGMTGTETIHWNVEKFSSEKMAMLFFRKMLVEMVAPNHITFIGILNACIKLNDIDVGKEVHCFITKLGFGSNSFVGSALVGVYAKCGFVEYAHRVFDEIQFRDLVVWNVMVSGYVLNGLGEEAFKIFHLMRFEGATGDGFTFSSLLNACSNLSSSELGKQLQCSIIRLCLDSDVLVASALVDMYAKSGNIEDAYKAFNGMKVRNLVSWTTMIVGYVQNGEGKAAMELFRRMLREGLRPDELTLASLLSSCANLAAVNEAIQFHAFVMKSGLEAFLSIGNALISAYSKCGCISSAFQSFFSITKPDLVTWTSMINAYAFHGLAREALEIFEKMLDEGLRPDGIAFVGVLSACSHTGLVNQGLHYFYSMRRDYQIIPDSEHYTCLIDLLGRSGRLGEAYDVLINMPFEPSANVLGAFVGACKVHGNLRLAEWAVRMLFELQPNETVNYTIMSNIYAAFGSWSEVARMRKLMKNCAYYKVPGCSWTEIGGKVHTFVSSDKSHPQALEMYSMLEILVRVMKVEILCQI